MCETNARVKYKLHGCDTVDGLVRSAETKHFYDSYEEAIEKARELMGRSTAPAGMYVFKAIAYVEREIPPIRVTRL